MGAFTNRLVIGVVGLGYVGLTTATVLAYYGYRVIGVDIDSHKVEEIKKGRAPIYEPNLNDMLYKAVDNLLVSTSYNDLAEADIIFVAVGTPSLSDGGIDLSPLYAAVKSLGGVISSSKKDYPVVAIKSTVVPGTARRVAKMLEGLTGLRLSLNFSVVSNPEFLREGRAVEDTLRPSRVVIGELDEKGASVLEEFWKGFYSNKLGLNPPILRVKAETAEMIKYASNAFLAAKISFINTIARICERIEGCDVVEVAKGMGLDPRINPHYLGAGLGYGGSCFPKDVKALIAFGKELCVDVSLLEAVDRINETQSLHVVKRLEGALNGLEGRIVAILGAAFKPNTDDVRESRSLMLAKLLAERGAVVRLHDPNPSALSKAKRVLGDGIEYYENVEEALRGADAAVVATEWDEYRHLNPRIFRELMRRPLVFDGRRVYSPEEFAREGVEFYAVGLGKG